MKRTHQNEASCEKDNGREPSSFRPRRNTLRAVAPEEYRDFIGRWRRAILRTAAVPAAVKQTLHQLSDYELATYLAVKCRGGKLPLPALRLP